MSTRKHASTAYPLVPLQIRTRSTYDYADRPVKTYKRIDNSPATDPEVILVHHEYK